ncbi:aminotransferase class V-fold PLP-dependent enzyme [Actinokineospora pegani]|uniref:aminotransferase class V-fold PLP-dependent enzyme n=1 Tax=Actinokineospora pegani TaxID=2654637 RepID=UPI0012EA1A5C|nr:aminotransferase class V-fold PLP-dependent enzyme [Actinokineospora pegani]
MSASDFALDPAVHHLNPGAFGIVPAVVRAAQARYQRAADANPMRFHRVDGPALVARAREAAGEFLGAEVVLVRNATEAAATVLAAADLRAGEEVLVSDHGYGAIAHSARSTAERTGARVRVAPIPVGATSERIVAAFAAGLTDRTKLVLVDAISSATALVLPVAEIAAVCRERGALVHVDAAHAPGHLRQRPDQLGAHTWAGNLHKWAYTPNTSAALWIAPEHRERVRPLVPSWEFPHGYPRWFDHAGTSDYSGWMAIPDGLAYWASIGGWDAVDAGARSLDRGVEVVSAALGAPGQVSPLHAPLMRLVRLPAGRVVDLASSNALYAELSARGVEAAVVEFGGEGFVRLAGSPHITENDYRALADALTAQFA